MSTDQQYVGGQGGRMGYQHEQMHERRIPVHERFVPFLAPFLMTFIVVPALASLTWVVGHFFPSTVPMFAMGWTATGFVAAIAGVLIGKLVTKRTPLIYWSVGGTALLWGGASAWTSSYGWSAVWGVVHFFGSLCVGVFWDLLRIDSLRSAGGANEGRNVWGEVIGLKTSHPRKVVRTEAGAEIEIAHGVGETADDVRSAAKKIESELNAVVGRTTVTPAREGRAGSSLIRLSLVDVFKDWWTDPGPSHPGGTFALPLRTGYYETGEYAWFSFAKSVPSPITDFVSPMDTFMGLAGTTGAGKSGDLNLTVREALTRTDAIVCWLDRAKLKQNASWCLDMLGLAGDNDTAKDFVKALRKLGEYRETLFGDIALEHIDEPGDIGRSWTPELAALTGEAAILIVVDEADIAMQGADWEFIATKGRSVGLYPMPATPRASAAEVPALIRGSIAAWKTFAIGDNYSDGFTISNETADAGADPKRLREPGMHYMDRAPGVDLRHCATLIRTFNHSTGGLRASVLKYRGVTFQPMGFSEGAVKAMGAHYQRCLPGRFAKTVTPPPADEPMWGDTPQITGPDAVKNFCLGVASGMLPAPPEQVEEARRILRANKVAVPPLPRPAPVPDDETPAVDAAVEEDDQEEDDDMTPTAQGTDELAGDARPIDPKTLHDAEEMMTFRNVDFDEPIVPNAGPQVGFRHVKPAWEPDATEQELDRAIVMFARAGKRTFTNGDVLETMRCYFDPSTCSRRLRQLSDGERTAPGGLTIEKVGRGEFQIQGELDMNYGRES